MLADGVKVVYHSRKVRKCMKTLGLEEGRGGVLTLFFLQGFWWRDWAWYACTFSRGRWSRDYTRHIWMHFLIGKIVCNPNCLTLLGLGSFAGAGAHHQGLRRLKPCRFQRTVYWHCECDKTLFKMLVWSYWQFVVHGQGAVKQMGLVSPGFNLHFWKFHRKLKVRGQLLVQDSMLIRDVVRK